MKKIKIAFMAPETRGGPYFIYKVLVRGLKEKYSSELDVYFFNSKKDWLKLHFKKYDYIFSVIPFLFKPLGCQKYIYNLHGNYKIEKKRKGLGNKLLYLAQRNLFFSDTIILNSFFLADKLKFGDKYKNKIFILENPININNHNNHIKRIDTNKGINILTISSTKFLEKGMGIIDLGKQIYKISDININWTIIAGGDFNNKKILLDKFGKIKFTDNIKIEWYDWIEKNKLKKYYNSANIFLYGSQLDTWGQTIMEAMSYNLPIILLNYELWEYIYPKEIITMDIEKNIKNILDNYEYYSTLSYTFVKKYDSDNITEHLFNFIITTNDSNRKNNKK